MITKLKDNPEKLFWPLLILAVLPWFWLHAQMAINLDVAWLMTGALRLLDGYNMAEYIYEPNPPLAILIHLPPALLTKFIGIPAWYSSFFYFTALLAAFLTTTYAILKRWDFLSAADTKLILAVLAVTSTILATTDFGERDQLIFFGLFLFVLGQIALTYDWAFPEKLRWPVFLIGALLILLKPHHGLLPTLLLLHRMIKKRQFLDILKQADFLSLAIMTSSYIALCWFFFNDYVTVILPDVIELYLGGGKFDTIINSLKLAGAILGLLFLTIFLKALPQSKTLVRTLYFAAFISIIPFLVQMLNLYYHLLPALAFAAVALALSVHFVLKKLISETHSLFVITVITIATAYTVFPLNFAYPTHREYKDFALSKLISNCPDCDNFFAFTQHMRILQPTILYTGKEHASRFPVYWFLPKILEGLEKNDINAAMLARKYSAMTAEDFQKHKPDLVLIEKFKILKDKPPFDFITFFSQNPAFKEEWQNYEYVDNITFNRRNYLPNTSRDFDKMITYEVYKRKI